MSPRVAKLLRRDLDRCVELERELFPGEDPWSRSAFLGELDQGNHYLGVFEGEQLLGYGGLAVVAPPPDAEAEVRTMAVDPARQGAGLGRMLLRALLAPADEIDATVFLEVRTDNEPAMKLYKDHGFDVVGVRKGYYQPSGADAYTMRRPPRSAEGGGQDG